MTIGEMDAMLGEMLRAYLISRVSPGERAGRRAVLSLIEPLTQNMLHATRGGGKAAGIIDKLQRLHGFSLIRGVTEGMRDRHPIISMLLKPPTRRIGQLSKRGIGLTDKQAVMTDYLANVAFTEKHRAVPLKSVLIEAHLLAVAPDKITEKMPIIGKLAIWLRDATKITKELFAQQAEKSWFYIVYRFDSIALHLNRVDPRLVANRIHSSYRSSFNYVVSHYDNQEGLYVICNVLISSERSTIDNIRALFETITENALIHGHDGLSNGSVIPCRGFSISTASDGTKGALVPTTFHRAMFNGEELAYIAQLPDVDVSTITSSDLYRTADVYGVSEASFREGEILLFECGGNSDLSKIQKQHIQMMTSFLGYNGRLTFIPRSGVARNPHIDLLTKMSFETPDMFLRDAIRGGAPTPIRSDTACMLYGKPSPYGSGISTVYMSAKSLYPSDTPSDVMEAITGDTWTLGSTTSKLGDVIPRKMDDVIDLS
jgi:hypothetical protein